MVSNEKIKLLDRTGQSVEQDRNLWPALVITKEEIDTEIERLADLPIPENGRRQSLFVHPRATAPGLGLAPGITLSLNVLKPGERTAPFRHNATEVNFCIQGAGQTEVAGKTIRFNQYDVWNHPSYTAYVMQSQKLPNGEWNLHPNTSDYMVEGEVYRSGTCCTPICQVNYLGSIKGDVGKMQVYRMCEQNDLAMTQQRVKSQPPSATAKESSNEQNQPASSSG